MLEKEKRFKIFEIGIGHITVPGINFRCERQISEINDVLSTHNTHESNPIS